MKLEEVILYDDRASQPLATTVPVGTLYYVTDEGLTERSNGTTWDDFTDTGGVGLSQLTGDVTAGPGTGSQAATIANDAVTNAKAANMAASTIKGRAAGAGTGDPTDLTGAQVNTIIGRTKTFGIVIDGGGSAITTGVKGFVRIPEACTITKNTMLSVDAAATAGSIVIDVWKDSYANYPPTVADTITAAAKPTLSAAAKSEDSTLTGWTTSVSAGDVIGFKVDSAATVTKVLLLIEASIP